MSEPKTRLVFPRGQVEHAGYTYGPGEQLDLPYETAEERAGVDRLIAQGVVGDRPRSRDIAS